MISEAPSPQSPSWRKFLFTERKEAGEAQRTGRGKLLGILGCEFLVAVLARAIRFFGEIPIQTPYGSRRYATK